MNNDHEHTVDMIEAVILTNFKSTKLTWVWIKADSYYHQRLTYLQNVIIYRVTSSLILKTRCILPIVNVWRKIYIVLKHSCHFSLFKWYMFGPSFWKYVRISSFLVLSCAFFPYFYFLIFCLLYIMLWNYSPDWSNVEVPCKNTYKIKKQNWE